MYCYKCGHKLPDGARFCSGCGTPVASSPESVTAAPAKEPVLPAKYKEEVYDVLAKVMLDGLDNGKVTVEESKQLSDFVLNQFDRVETRQEFYEFLFLLSKKWPIYRPTVKQLFS